MTWVSSRCCKALSLIFTFQERSLDKDAAESKRRKASPDALSNETEVKVWFVACSVWLCGELGREENMVAWTGTVSEEHS